MDSQARRDAEHLELLSIFHYIVAAMMAAFGSFPTCMPFGTALGVFTIIVLMRPSVKQVFGVAQ